MYYSTVTLLEFNIYIQLYFEKYKSWKDHIKLDLLMQVQTYSMAKNIWSNSIIVLIQSERNTELVQQFCNKYSL